jgi:hypothetical protein
MKKSAIISLLLVPLIAVAQSSPADSKLPSVDQLIEKHDTNEDGKFVIRKPSTKPPQNLLLYVVIGDPALRPFVDLKILK